MKRRNFIRNSFGFGLAMHPLVKALQFSSTVPGAGVIHAAGISSGLPVPVMIYDNWSTYDTLSDNIPLTEELAMKELRELLRWKNDKVSIDYYIIDAFWFDKQGGYRTFDKQHWPNGPGKWLDACKEKNIRTGLWFAVNLIASGGTPFLDVIPEWKGSLAAGGATMCLFEGGYLAHLAETLQIWVDRGVKSFMFDFAYFNAATPEAMKVYLPSEIEEMNKLAFYGMLKTFRLKNPEVLLIAFNGFGGQMDNTYETFRKTVDTRWLEVFDSLYCGDPRFSDVPTMNIWRSEDIYSDHMVRQFEFNGLPLQRIANCEFMIGKTGTCYYRADKEWKDNAILDMARGGWANIYYGNLELLNDEDARWFAKAQSMFHQLQKFGIFSSFGAVPGTGKPYGYKAADPRGTVATVVNPMQEVAVVELPVDSFSKSRVIYADGGFKPVLKGNKLTLGPEQMAVAGFDGYSGEKYILGTDDTVKIPFVINNLDITFKETAKNTILAEFKPPMGKDIRIIFQQFGNDGLPKRSWGGAPPDGKKMDAFLKIIAEQDGKPIPVYIEYDKMIWSGLSWAAGEIKQASFAHSRPIRIECNSTETDKLSLKAMVYAVNYENEG